MIVDGLESQLRPDVDSRKAVSLIRALSSAEVCFELVRGEGWTPDEYENWLGGLLIDLLLSSPSSA